MRFDADLQPPSWVVHALAGLGAVSVSYWMLQGMSFFLNYVRPSKLPKYRHCSAGSWALVTGASDGIGRAFVEELILRGFHVVLHGRNEVKLQGIVDELSRTHKQTKLRIFVADATKVYDLDVAKIRRQMEELPGKLTLLVNNVGGIHSGRTYQTLDGYTSRELIDCINANATFTTLMTSTLLPLLKENGPSLILNCGSIVPFVCPPFIAAYVGSKGYIHAWASSLRLEIKAQGYGSLIEVLTVAIGNTASHTNTYEETGLTLTAKACAKSCLDRVGCGSEIIVPHPTFLLSVLPFYILPSRLIRIALVPILKRRYNAEEQAEKAAKKE